MNERAVRIGRLVALRARVADKAKGELARARNKADEVAARVDAAERALETFEDPELDTVGELEESRKMFAFVARRVVMERQALVVARIEVSKREARVREVESDKKKLEKLEQVVTTAWDEEELRRERIRNDDFAARGKKR